LHGRKVATVVDEVMPAGKHSVKFDAGNLPTGVYIVHKSAISNQQSAMAKLVVLR